MSFCVIDLSQLSFSSHYCFMFSISKSYQKTIHFHDLHGSYYCLCIHFLDHVYHLDSIEYQGCLKNFNFIPAAVISCSNLPAWSILRANLWRYPHRYEEDYCYYGCYLKRDQIIAVVIVAKVIFSYFIDECWCLVDEALKKISKEDCILMVSSQVMI